jgi:hypothetical protein
MTLMSSGGSIPILMASMRMGVWLRLGSHAEIDQLAQDFAAF